MYYLTNIPKTELKMILKACFRQKKLTSYQKKWEQVVSSCWRNFSPIRENEFQELVEFLMEVSIITETSVEQLIPLVKEALTLLDIKYQDIKKFSSDILEEILQIKKERTAANVI